MADAGLFIGWGSEVVRLYPHGGDLYGFILVRGSQEQLNGLQADEEFMRFNARLPIALAVTQMQWLGDLPQQWQRARRERSRRRPCGGARDPRR